MVHNLAKAFTEMCFGRIHTCILQEAKTDTASQARMALLKPRGSAAAAARPRAEVVLKVKGPGGYKQVGRTSL